MHLLAPHIIAVFGLLQTPIGQSQVALPSKHIKASVLLKVKYREKVNSLSMSDDVQYPSIIDALWTQSDQTIFDVRDEFYGWYDLREKTDPVFYQIIVKKIDKTINAAQTIKERHNLQRSLANKKPIKSFAKENKLRMKKGLKPIGGYARGYKRDHLLDYKSHWEWVWKEMKAGRLMFNKNGDMLYRP
ncbi:MAG: hypothetical protein H8E27_01260 [Verrucomicrobia subdivision 3 bacterium]|nr:hypothetical protein [Limisphaerales bacterium]